jgi:hypothetical protein
MKKAMKLKFILLMVCVAVLFAIFTFSLGGAFFDKPEYEDYCTNNYYPAYATPYAKGEVNCSTVKPSVELETSCRESKGRIAEKYDNNGCISEYFCELCDAELAHAQEKYHFSLFLAMSILGIIAIITALIISTTGVKEWILNGFLLGGLASLFIGTIIYFADASQILRPIIMFVELALIIFVAVKKLKDK